MFTIDNRIYTPALRWKFGEMRALASLDRASRNRLLPHLIFMPLHARDNELNRPLSKDEFHKIQIGRLQTFWPSSPCLADFQLVHLDENEEVDAERIAEFLRVAKSFGCRLIPVLDFQTGAHRRLAMGEYARDYRSGMAIRITLADLQDNLENQLQTLVGGLGVTPADCVIILDMSDADISNDEWFATFTAEWLSKLHHFHLWHRVVVLASNYPHKNPASSNSEASAQRKEWLSWQRIVKSDPGITKWASFGDFGADHGHIEVARKGGGRRPITHLRYATADDWIIARGGEATASHDGSIYEVAKRIVSSEKFFGESFSAGDEFLVRCAQRQVQGSASTWRWANMVHHMTLALVGAANLAGTPLVRPVRAIPKQLMFELSS